MVTVGLAAIQAAKSRGASRIFAVDLNDEKFVLAKQLGATDCINPSKLGTTNNIAHYI